MKMGNTRCIDLKAAIELTAAIIEIGSALYRLGNYFKTHPYIFRLPSSLYRVEHTWYDLLHPGFRCITHDRKYILGKLVYSKKTEVWEDGSKNVRIYRAWARERNRWIFSNE